MGCSLRGPAPPCLSIFETQSATARAPSRRKSYALRYRWGSRRCPKSVRPATGLTSGSATPTSPAATSSERKAFDNAVGRAVASESIERRGDWLHSMHGSTVVRVPALDDAPRRPVEEVPPDEIELAITHLLADAGASRKADLREAWARLYGWRRVGPDIERAFDRAVRKLVEDKMVNGPDPLRLANGEPPRLPALRATPHGTARADVAS